MLGLCILLLPLIRVNFQTKSKHSFFVYENLDFPSHGFCIIRNLRDNADNAEFIVAPNESRSREGVGIIKESFRFTKLRLYK